MNDKIIIHNKNIADYVMFYLNKADNEFTKEELSKIKQITINYINETESSSVIINELLLFSNLETLIIRNDYIHNIDYEVLLKLSKLTEIVFEKCTFENASVISLLKIKSLSLINCNINDYSFLSIMTYLKQLTIINGNLEMSILNKLQLLEYLQLSYSKIIDTSTDINLPSLEELYIDNTNIVDLSFINDLPLLKKISLDLTQYQKNKNILEPLNITILNENMIELGDNDNAI